MQGGYTFAIVEVGWIPFDPTAKQISINFDICLQLKFLEEVVASPQKSETEKQDV